MNIKKTFFSISALVLLLVGGCLTHPDYANDFRFPILQGSIERGKETFVELECTQCHVVAGVDLPDYEGAMPVTIQLGDVIIFAKTYADLTTSIINPDYRLSEQYLQTLPRDERRTARTSPMHSYNNDMRVSELIDLVTFLNSRYILMDGYVEGYYR